MRLATDVPLKSSVARGNILVGVSGWSYAPWRGNFFPNGLPQKLELAYAARRFGALEVNGTFYSLQRPSTFTSWYNQTPPGSSLPSRAALVLLLLGIAVGAYLFYVRGVGMQPNASVPQALRWVLGQLPLRL